MWFSWDLEEHKYQLKIYESLLYTEKYLKGQHIEYFKEIVRRIKEDIYELDV